MFDVVICCVINSVVTFGVLCDDIFVVMFEYVFVVCVVMCCDTCYVLVLCVVLCVVGVVAIVFHM